ncbi:MAG: PhoH family protein [Bacteroidetes bacterium]|nr:PhoH family protein [Bacteroidota bacterium]
MSEKVIKIESIDPLEFYGASEANINRIRELFPAVKIITRGDTIKIAGTEEETEILIEKLETLFDFLQKFGRLTETDVEKIVLSTAQQSKEVMVQGENILVHGKNGMLIKARSANQQKMVDSFVDNDLLFAIGPAGSGKTYTAVALAVRALKNREIRRIILTRPAVEAGESLGFLPGDMKEKLDPYLQPLYDALNDMIPSHKLAKYMEERTIQIAPLAYMRGRTLDHAVAILDEAQNSTIPQLKMFLTRMGRNSKFIVTGDVTQIDLPGRTPSGLLHAQRILTDIEGISIVNLDESDIIRHRLVIKIVKAYQKHENE